MRCAHCQYEADYPFKFCPECGLPAADEDVVKREETEPDPSTDSLQTAEPVLMHDKPAEPTRTAYVRSDYNPARDGRYRYQPAVSGPTTAGQDTSRPIPASAPSTTGTILMSIVNMLCCGFGISMVLGLIALIFAIIATSERNPDEAVRKIGWSKKLNIVGLVFIVLQVIVVVLVIVFMIAEPSTTGSYFDFPLS